MNPTYREYPQIIKDFAIQLSYHSTKAYNFVRKATENALPHINTVRSWQARFETPPGFNKSIIPAIKSKINQELIKGRKLKFSLQMDGMYINSTIQRDQKGNTYGFVNDGSEEETESMPKIAKEALVFLINAANGRWKVPVAYYFINGLKTEQLARIVEDVIFFLESNQIDIISLTFDGHKTNISVCEYLGAKFCLNDLKPYFFSLNGTKIYILLDLCHMLKLIRNHFAAKKIIYDDTNEPVNWYYLWKLNEIQKVEGLTFANKITDRHISFANEKMKVKLASQLFSKSAADSLSYLQSTNKYNQTFSKCSSTIRFVEIMNNMFDVFNSMSLYSTYSYKRALSPKNYVEIFSYLDDCVVYLKSLSYLGANNEKV